MSCCRCFTTSGIDCPAAETAKDTAAMAAKRKTRGCTVKLHNPEKRRGVYIDEDQGVYQDSNHCAVNRTWAETMAGWNRFATLLRWVLAAIIAGLLLNAPAQAMSADCHIERMVVSIGDTPLEVAPAGDHHRDKTMTDRLCCAKACIVCGASIPSSASVAWTDDIPPAYSGDQLTGMTGQNTPAVFEPPRSVPL